LKPKKRPLYKNHAASQERPPDAHTGLWFDKFCDWWCRDPDPEKTGLASWSLTAFTIKKGPDKGDYNPKFEWIRTVTGSLVGNSALLAEHATRLANLARALGGQTLVFKTTSRFASGLGREHPIENGFVWHPVLGVPYLPGSSVKGLVRAWLEGGWVDQPPQPQSFHRIFGSDYRRGPALHDRERNLPNQCGTVLFLDALPVAPVQLKADVMTPHYGDYYQGNKDSKGGPTPPADWLSPNPIPFLTVAPGQLFQFVLAPATPNAGEDCNTAASWLEAALNWLGAGAKTAVGYGRFTKAEAAKLVAEQPPASSHAVPARPASPRFKPGQRITAQRVHDPKGKGRVWFQAEDGFGGVVTGGPPPQVELGQTTELEIASVTQGMGYNFRLPRTTPPPVRPATSQPRR
jgi:CRISPR-associated protein Cmr6